MDDLPCYWAHLSPNELQSSNFGIADGQNHFETQNPVQSPMVHSNSIWLDDAEDCEEYPRGPYSYNPPPYNPHSNATAPQTSFAQKTAPLPEPPVLLDLSDSSHVSPDQQSPFSNGPSYPNPTNPDWMVFPDQIDMNLDMEDLEDQNESALGPRKKKYNRNVTIKTFNCKVCGILCKQEKTKYGTCYKCVRFFLRATQKADFHAGRACKKGGNCDLTFKNRIAKKMTCAPCRIQRFKELGFEAVKPLSNHSNPTKIECTLNECKACGKTVRKNGGNKLFCSFCDNFYSIPLKYNSDKWKTGMCPNGGGCDVMYRKDYPKRRVCKWCLYRRCVSAEMENSGQQDVADVSDVSNTPDIPNTPEVSENPESLQQLSQKDQDKNCLVCGNHGAYFVCMGFVSKVLACCACYNFFQRQVYAQKAGQELKCVEDAEKCAFVKNPKLFVQRHCKKCRFQKCLDIGMKTLRMSDLN